MRKQQLHIYFMLSESASIPLLKPLYLQELKELIASYQTLRESGRGPAICNTIIETARQCNLDKDIKLPEEDAKELDLAQRDSLVGQAYSRQVPFHTVHTLRVEVLNPNCNNYAAAREVCIACWLDAGNTIMAVCLVYMTVGRRLS
jgi:hypothetical protein